MTEFDFLKNMFRRLNEAKHFEREMEKNPQKENHDCDCGSLAIECIIKEYLELRTEK